ncbi:MAG: DUF86 domain-containing protein [Chloroflexota bacterium]
MDDSARLRHILDAIERVVRYTAGGRGQFMADELVQDAVMRNLEIIGEAAKALSSETTGRAPTVAWRNVSGMRDHLVHGYFGVDLDIVWNAVTEDLPGLRAAVEMLLDHASE